MYILDEGFHPKNWLQLKKKGEKINFTEKHLIFTRNLKSTKKIK